MCCVVVVAAVVVVVIAATAVTAIVAASGLMIGASSSARHCSMISSSDMSGSLSANSLNKRSAVSKFHTSGWPERTSTGHSSGVAEELDGESGIESTQLSRRLPACTILGHGVAGAIDCTECEAS